MYNLRTLPLLLFSLLSFPFASQAHATKKPCHSISVKGTVLGYKGTPLARSHVKLSQGMANKFIAITTTNEKGHFSLQVCLHNPAMLSFLGVHHQSLSLPLIPKQPIKLKLRIHLQAHRYHSHPKEIHVIGDFNRFRRKGARTLTRRADGTFQLKMPWKNPHMRYQLLGLIEEKKGYYGGYSAGTQGTFHLDKHAYSYLSSIKTKEGIAHIIFSPKALPNKTGKEKIEWLQAPKTVQNHYAAYIKLTTNIKKARKAFDAIQKKKMAWYRHKRKKGTPRPRYSLKSFGFDVQKHLAEIEQAWKQAKDPTTKKLYVFHLAFSRFWRYRPKPNWIKAFCKAWGPTSSMWTLTSYESYLLPFVFGSTKRRWACLPAIEEYAKKLPDEYGRVLLLSSTARILHSTKAQIIRRYYAGYHPASFYLELLRQQYIKLNRQHASAALLKKVDRQLRGTQRILHGRTRLRPGQDLPSFTLKALPHPNNQLTPRDYTKRFLKGKWSLLYFWAIWCGACTGSLPRLVSYHRSLKKHKDIVFLSIALERSTTNTLRHLKKWPAPWHQAILPNAFQSTLSKQLYLNGVPTYILVSPKGKVILSTNQIRDIKKALNKHLNTPTTQKVPTTQKTPATQKIR